MKTFSAMSNPDKKLTLQAYEHLHLLFKTLSEEPSNIPKIDKVKLAFQAARLVQLMEALKEELLIE